MVLGRGEPGDKLAYEHVFVVLAAATAGDETLLGEALEVLETHFWEERYGALADVRSRDWSQVEAYRGANANMHGVEAMIATGDALWLDRARRITRRLTGGVRVIEHYDPIWRPLRTTTARSRRIRSGRTASTPGHGFEWARLAFGLGFEEEARRLFAGAIHDGWDGCGFVYTVDFDGRPVVRARLHWVLCEAIAAAAVLGERDFERAWWEIAERRFIDREGGSWWHELDVVEPAGLDDLGRQAGRLPRARRGRGVAQAGAFLSSVPGGGVIAAAVMTSANAARRSSSAPVSSGSGSWKTTGPAAIVITLAVALVSAITATTGPSCSDFAEISSATSDHTTMIAANEDAADPDPGVPGHRLDRDVAARPQQARGDREGRAVRAVADDEHDGGDGRRRERDAEHERRRSPSAPRRPCP